MKLKQLVKEVLENKDCCKATKRTNAPILNESLAPREILSEGLKYHIDTKKPLTEHVYRAGSENYFNLWAEARTLYTRGILDFSGDDLEILTETNLGEFGIVEGKKVPLDFPMLEENKDITFNVGDIIEINPKSFPSFEFPYGTRGKIFDINKADYASDNLVYTVKIKYIDGQGDESNTLYIEDSNQYLNEYKIKNKSILEDIKIFGKIYESVNIENSYSLDNIESDENSNSFIFTDKHGIQRKLSYFKGGSIKLLWLNPSSNEWSTEKIPSKYEDEKVMNTFGKILVKIILPKYNSFAFKALNAARYRLFRALIYTSLDTSKYEMDFNDETMEIEVYSKNLNEAKNENKPIGKPMRDSSGGKAYKVYVRDPKTKKIKTVRFGSGGLKAKINNPKARKAFAKRHNCAQKNDRTKASYWSCRLPRYAKLLGLKSNFSGFW